MLWVRTEELRVIRPVCLAACMTTSCSVPLPPGNPSLTTTQLPPQLTELRQNMALRITSLLRLRAPAALSVRTMSKGMPGSGKGEGGGAGGNIRDAGGSFGKREQAQEEQYFRKLQKEQLEKMRDSLKMEVEFHKDQVKAHKDAIKRHEERLEKLE